MQTETGPEIQDKSDVKVNQSNIPNNQSQNESQYQNQELKRMVLEIYQKSQGQKLIVHEVDSTKKSNYPEKKDHEYLFYSIIIVTFFGFNC